MAARGRHFIVWQVAFSLAVLSGCIYLSTVARATPIGCDSPAGVWDDVEDDSRVSITFDETLLRGQTDQILNTFAEYGMRTTFFQVGSEVKQRPGIAARIVAEGHELANHTETHPHLIEIANAWDEIRGGHRTIKRTT